MTPNDDKLRELIETYDDLGLSTDHSALTELLQRREQPVQTSVEHMNDHFMKVHLHGLPVAAVLHRFTKADGPDAEPHDHPWAFRSLIISGGYVEQVFTDYCMKEIERRPGDTFRNEAGTIHRIVRLLDAECWTLIFPEAWERKPGFYHFDGGSVFHRFWDEHEMRPLVKGER